MQYLQLEIFSKKNVEMYFWVTGLYEWVKGF